MTCPKSEHRSMLTVATAMCLVVIVSTPRDTLAQNPNGPPGTAGIRVPSSVSSMDFTRMKYLRGRDIVDLDPIEVSRAFDAALRNPQRFQLDAVEAAANILRTAPGSPQAALADAYATMVTYRMRCQVDGNIHRQLARMMKQYPLSPAVGMLYEAICQDLVARGQKSVALDLLAQGHREAANDQQRRWLDSYAEFIRTSTDGQSKRPGAPPAPPEGAANPPGEIP